MKYVSHPLVKPQSLEERSYQLAVAMRALDGNTMVVLPTGLGKTAVALLVAAARLRQEGGKILMLAPTKPLVEQHLRFFEQHMLKADEEDRWGTGCAMFTGATPIEERAAMWQQARFIFATPQVIKNDVLAGRYSLHDVTLLIIDECHRAVGNYAYVFIGEEYRQQAVKPLLLAMTASPGSDREKVQAVCEALDIGIIESRTEADDDVRPYIHEREVQYVTVALPAPLARAVSTLQGMIERRSKQLSNAGYPVPRPDRMTMKALNILNASIQKRIGQRDPTAYRAASVYAEIMKLRHAVSLAESQGSVPLSNYLEKLCREGELASGSKASKRLAGDPAFVALKEETSAWVGEIHPKLGLLADIVAIQLENFPESRVIIFSTFRDTVQAIVDHLDRIGIAAERFVGQATKDAEKGLTQKRQLETLQRFREGEFHVLIATSIGEEGLDVPSTDLVVFYEAVPSEIRSIQRKGRTGRHGAGRIVVLVTKGTSDEAFRYVSQSREQAMQSGIRELSVVPRDAPVETPGPAGQRSIGDFVRDGPAVAVDDRETQSRVVEYLHRLGAAVEIRRLEQGDYQVGGGIVIERKTTKDFMDSLVERDLLGQVRELAEQSLKPILIVEGDDLYTARNIHQNAVRGALAAIAVDLGVTVFQTKDAEETAAMVYVLARRAEGGREPKAHHPHKTMRSVREQQEYVVSAFPGVGLKNARALLEHFRSVEAVIKADPADLTQVKGVGEKMAKSIRDLSTREYR
jgi:ERCC4-related helicase